MPVAPPRICRRPGCRSLVTDERPCPRHPRQAPTIGALLADRARGSARQRGYDSTWQRLRAAVLAEQPLCLDCEDRGVTTPAVDVDHVVELRDGGSRLDRDNLRPLCRGCHAKKTQRVKRWRTSGSRTT